MYNAKIDLRTCDYIENLRNFSRFTKDVDTVDVILPGNIRAFVWCTLVVLGTLIVISISTPWFLAIVLPLGVLYVLIQV